MQTNFNCGKKINREITVFNGMGGELYFVIANLWSKVCRKYSLI